MSTPPIGNPGSDDPFEKMRIRPVVRREQEDDEDQDPHGSPAAEAQAQGFPQQQSFPQAPAPNSYAPQPPAAPPYAQPGFAPQQPSPYGQQIPDPYTGGLPEGPGHLAFDTGFFWLAWVFFLTGPSVRVDGAELVRAWGKQLAPVAPGQHFVEIHTRYLWPIGRASLQVFVQPGQTVPVFYKAPTLVWLKGAIGHEQQKAPGMVYTLIVLALIPLFACVVPLLSLLVMGR